MQYWINFVLFSPRRLYESIVVILYCLEDWKRRWVEKKMCGRQKKKLYIIGQLLILIFEEQRTMNNFFFLFDPINNSIVIYYLIIPSKTDKHIL